MEYKTFLALEREASVWIGNSSAQMSESSSFHVPVVNIGNRQKGRERGHNVIDVAYDKGQITKAIKKSLYDKKYLVGLKKIKNPYGNGHTSQRIVSILEKLKITPQLLDKTTNF